MELQLLSGFSIPEQELQSAFTEPE